MANKHDLDPAFGRHPGRGVPGLVEEGAVFTVLWACPLQNIGKNILQTLQSRLTENKDQRTIFLFNLAFNVLVA